MQRWNVNFLCHLSAGQVYIQLKEVKGMDPHSFKKIELVLITTTCLNHFVSYLTSILSCSSNAHVSALTHNRVMYWSQLSVLNLPMLFINCRSYGMLSWDVNCLWSAAFAFLLAFQSPLSSAYLFETLQTIWFQYLLKLIKLITYCLMRLVSVLLRNSQLPI